VNTEEADRVSGWLKLVQKLSNIHLSTGIVLPAVGRSYLSFFSLIVARNRVFKNNNITENA